MRDATAQDLRAPLERLRARALRNGWIERDPLRLVLDYRAPADRETVGLLCALLAYGRVDPLRAHIRALLDHLGARPAERLRAGVPRLPRLVYRFHRTSDLTALLRGIRAVSLRHGSLGRAFASRWRESGDLRISLTGFAAEIREAAGGRGVGLRYLLADPSLGSACKRWLLYLRWMVRCERGDPDPGVWRRYVPPSALLVPLDTHVVRVGRRLGLTSLRTPSWRMAEEVTASLRLLSPEDPVRYDFPLCHLGISGTCPPRLTAEHCRRCPLAVGCPTSRCRRGGRAAS